MSNFSRDIRTKITKFKIYSLNHFTNKVLSLVKKIEGTLFRGKNESTKNFFQVIEKTYSELKNRTNLTLEQNVF